MIEMVCLVPGRMADAEAFLLVARRSCHVDGGTVIQGLVRIIPPQIRESTADANSRNSSGVSCCGGRGHKKEGNAGVQSEGTRKVVSQSGSEIVDAAGAAVTSFDLPAHRPAGSETSAVIFFGPPGHGGRGFSEAHAPTKEKHGRA